MPTPEPKGTEVLLEVTHCGVCHSDLHIWEGYYDLGGGKRMSLKDRGVVLPLAMGHEIVGRVVKLGPEAEGVAVGDLRIVFPWLGCGHCDRCLAEEDNMCLVSRALGVFQNGGYATHVVAPHARHLVDPGTLDPALAATYACSGHHGLFGDPQGDADRAGQADRAGRRGRAGLERDRGAEGAGAPGDRRRRRQRGEAAGGAGRGRDRGRWTGAGEGVAERIVEACGGPAEAIIDLVNGTATAAFAFAALRKGGKLVQVGLFGGELSLPLPVMAMRALTVRGSYVGNPKELRELVALAQDERHAGMPITEMPQSQANEALMRLRDGKVTGRVVLTAA